MAPLVKELQKYPDRCEVVVCVSAQHREMLDQVLDLFGIAPKHDLNIMEADQDLYDVTSRVLLGMREVLRREQPDVVLVHGDTTTSTAAALASFYQHIPVGHVEAGLRTHDISSPWPEEMNRQITGRIAAYNFAPTIACRINLLNEGIPEDRVVVTGNTVIDALLMMCDRIRGDRQGTSEIKSRIRQMGYDVERLSGQRRLVLITGHRRESFGDGLLQICSAIKTLALTYPGVDFLYPMHLNQNVRRPIRQVFGGVNVPTNVFFIEPLEYLPFVFLMTLCYLVLTDSGGIQEEAPSLGKPVLVTRNTTERPEALEAGAVELVGTDYGRIVRGVSSLLDDGAHYDQMRKAVNPYGDGFASKRIVTALL